MIEKVFKINTVSLEGPDLSGKSTLYNCLHKMSGFGWDIRDRSSLSRVCFARQFNRDVESERLRLEKELCNLNNRMIVLMPDFDVIEKRYHSRGDEIQDLDSLRRLYDIYEEEVEKIETLPGVLALRSSDSNICLESYDFIEKSESETPRFAGVFAREHVTNHEKNELSLICNLSGNVTKPESDDILQDPLEGSYYREILWDLENVIRKELRGLNPYNKPQDSQSRRFYYSSDSCISSVHMMPRGETMICNATFRSTNVVKNAEIDIFFLDYLIKRLTNKYFFQCKRYTIDLKINSAHVLKN